MEIEKLKAIAFDLMMQRDMISQRLNQVLSEIQKVQIEKQKELKEEVKDVKKKS